MSEDGHDDVYAFDPWGDRPALFDEDGFREHASRLVSAMTNFEQFSGQNASKDLMKAYSESGSWDYVELLAVQVVQTAAALALLDAGRENPLLPSIVLRNLEVFNMTYRSLRARRELGLLDS